MPPRYAYWTIILEGAPTAFRAHASDELVPTLKQLQARHPDTVMKWFARGRLWDSPEQERMAAALRKRAPRERRPEDWRPGGEHRDPRARFKVPRDEKRRRFAAKLRRERTSPRPPEGRDEKRGAGPRGEGRAASPHGTPRGQMPRQQLRGRKPSWKQGGGGQAPAGRNPRGPRAPRKRGGKGGGGQNR